MNKHHNILTMMITKITTFMKTRTMTTLTVTLKTWFNMLFDGDKLNLGKVRYLHSNFEGSYNILYKYL